jgi:hypothetical protein
MSGIRQSLSVEFAEFPQVPILQMLSEESRESRPAEIPYLMHNLQTLSAHSAGVRIWHTRSAQTQTAGLPQKGQTASDQLAQTASATKLAFPEADARPPMMKREWPLRPPPASAGASSAATFQVVGRGQAHSLLPRPASSRPWRGRA